MDLPLCRIEFASTLALIDSYFTKGMTVADIGGGPGRYAIELLKRGCHVTLFDLSAENIALARTKLTELGLTAEEFLVGMPEIFQHLLAGALTVFWHLGHFTISSRERSESRS